MPTVTEEVGDVVALLAVTVMLIIVLVTAALLGHLDRTIGAVDDLWHRLRPRREVAETVSIEQLAADLRRLAAHLEQTYDTDQPAKMERLAAAALAYDWVLLSACRTLEIPLPKMPPLDAVSRLQTEAELARQSLDW